MAGIHAPNPDPATPKIPDHPPQAPQWLLLHPRLQPLPQAPAQNALPPAPSRRLGLHHLQPRLLAPARPQGGLQPGRDAGTSGRPAPGLLPGGRGRLRRHHVRQTHAEREEGRGEYAEWIRRDGGESQRAAQGQHQEECHRAGQDVAAVFCQAVSCFWCRAGELG